MEHPPPLLVTSVALQGNVDVASTPCGSLWSLQEQGLESCALGKLCCCELLLGVYPGPLYCVEVEVKGKVNSEESSLCLPLAFETLPTCAIEHVHVAYTGGKLWVRKTSLCSEKKELYYGITVVNFLLLLTF